jgi:hypothetical protein
MTLIGLWFGSNRGPTTDSANGLHCTEVRKAGLNPTELLLRIAAKGQRKGVGVA